MTGLQENGAKWFGWRVQEWAKRYCRRIGVLGWDGAVRNLSSRARIDSVSEMDEEWSRKGGVSGWKCQM